MFDHSHRDRNLGDPDRPPGSSRARRRAGIAFVLFLWLPLSQQLTGWAGQPAPLGGVETPVEAPGPWTGATWFAGRIQAQLDTWYARALGFRNWIVRTDNQLRLSVFGEFKAGVTLGRDDQLFNDDHRTERNWTTPRRTAEIERRIAGLEELRRELARHGVHCGVVLSPVKNLLYPEFLTGPEGRAAALDRETVYAVTRRALDRTGVRTWDLVERFREWKASAPVPVFPQAGLHWTRYASARAAVEILTDLDGMLPKTVPALELRPTRRLQRPVPPDDDLIDLANVWNAARFHGTTQDFELALATGGTATTARPGLRMLVVGTSFIGTMFPAFDLACDRLTSYHYFRTRYQHDGGHRSAAAAIPVTPAELRTAILEHDVVLIEVYETRLDELGFGFIDAARRAFQLSRLPTALAAEVVTDADPAARSVRFRIDAGPDHAHRRYLLAGSASGTAPGVRVHGPHVALNPDAYTRITLFADAPGLLRGFRGRLDAAGRASATLVVPADLLPPQPVRLHHALLLLDRFGYVDYASETAAVVLRRHR